ncbi:hypothetical protein BDQ17DRAFT_1367014 [Cyathus striatus]|nr:hypothetical protein BDQ17DRAFT_1367014 [Cyathus striatus]
MSTIPLRDGFLLTSEFTIALEHLQIVNVFEYLITFELEVEFIWKSRQWTLVKILYLAARYIPFIDTSIAQIIPHSTPQLCLNMFNAVTWLILIGMSIAEIIFTTQWLAYFLSMYHITTWTGAYVVQGYPSTHLNCSGVYYRGCLITGGNISLLRVDWLFSLSTTSVNFQQMAMMVLMLIPAFKAFKRNGKSYMTRTVLRVCEIFVTLLDMTLI